MLNAKTEVSSEHLQCGVRTSPCLIYAILNAGQRLRRAETRVEKAGRWSRRLDWRSGGPCCSGWLHARECNAWVHCGSCSKQAKGVPTDGVTTRGRSRPEIPQGGLQLPKSATVAGCTVDFEASPSSNVRQGWSAGSKGPGGYAHPKASRARPQPVSAAVMQLDKGCGLREARSRRGLRLNSAVQGGNGKGPHTESSAFFPAWTRKAKVEMMESRGQGLESR